MSGSGDLPRARARRVTGGSGVRSIAVATSRGDPDRPGGVMDFSASAIPSRCSSRCSATTTANPASRPAASIAVMMLAAPSGSSWLVGSSRTSRRGRVASAEAIATRCRSPPESSPGRRSARCSVPTARIAQSTRSRMVDRAIPCCSRLNAISSSTRSVIIWASGSWKTNPVIWLSTRGPAVRVSSPPTMILPPNEPPEKCGISPLRHRSRLDLPLPDAPARTEREPAMIDQDSPCRASSVAPG